jgi:hypothetical protein
LANIKKIIIPKIPGVCRYLPYQDIHRCVT